MDLKELTTFQTILQEGNFSKAAAKLNYAQSTITNQVQRLEKELGIKLFKRGWDSELTAAGQIFATEIDKLIQHWNYVAEQAKALQKEEIGTLSIGGLESLTEQVLPNSLKRFRDYKPNVSCHFVIGNTASLSRSLLQNVLTLPYAENLPRRLRFTLSHCTTSVSLSSQWTTILWWGETESLLKNYWVTQSYPGNYLFILFAVIEAIFPLHGNSFSVYSKSYLSHCRVRPANPFLHRSRSRFYAITAKCCENPS